MTDDRYSVRLRFPGDIDYIPAVRKFVAEMLGAAKFSAKFAYRSEIIVDEVCHNAVTFGCQSPNAEIELAFRIHHDRVELEVKDPGKGKDTDRRRLKLAVERGASPDAMRPKEQLGLEIVKMLAEKLDFEIDENNLTSVRVVRRREDSAVSA